MSEPAGEFPYLTTEQMVEVDRAMVEDARIELIQMMENAGRHLAHLARTRFLNGDPRGREVAVLAGVGGNGGGALVCARRLTGWGARIRVYVARPAENFAPVPAHQLDIVRRMGIQVAEADCLPAGWSPELVVDGVIGYGIEGPPRDAAAAMIRWANEREVPILSLDVPSGLQATAGVIHEPAIRATATMTLALPKEGLRAPGVEEMVGELYLADIGVPPKLYSGPGLELQVGPLFAREEILRIR